jgi:chromosome segregation ATPase
MQYFGFKKNGETDTSSISFDGVSDGESVSLTFRDKYLTFLEGRTVMGTLKSDSMTLVFPQGNGALWTLEFNSASVAEYNNVVRGLQERARQAVIARAEAERIAAEKRAVVDALNRIVSIADRLGDKLRELPGAGHYADALRGYSDAWQEMREAHADMLEESKKRLTSHQLGVVEHRLGVVDHRLGVIQHRRGVFEGRLSSANTEIQDAEEEIVLFQSAFTQLQQAVAANSTGEPRATVTAEDVAKSVELARSEINKAVAARDAANSRAAAYDKQAADLYRQAEAFVKKLKPLDRD